MTVRADAHSLLKDLKYLMQSQMFACQKQCFNHASSFKVSKGNLDVEKAGILSDVEGTCLRECVDRQIFFDTTIYELDSAYQVSIHAGKPKKGHIYNTRRIDDLTSDLNAELLKTVPEK